MLFDKHSFKVRVDHDLVIDLRDAPPTGDIRSHPPTWGRGGDLQAGVHRVRLGSCLVDLVMAERLWSIMDGHLRRPPGSGTLLVASANLDHVKHFGDGRDGEGLDPGRMDDWLVLLDGIPLVLAARRLTGIRYPRLAGADLLPLMLGRAEALGASVAILGGSPDLPAAFTRVVGSRWPELHLVAHSTPARDELLDDEFSRRLVLEFAGMAPDLLVVALGKPLQERWMAQHARATGAKVVVAFGAAVDFVAETMPRAPQVLRDSGLEWVYRLVREPTRLWRRYLLEGPRALRALVADAAELPDAKIEEGSESSISSVGEVSRP